MQNYILAIEHSFQQAYCKLWNFQLKDSKLANMCNVFQIFYTYLRGDLAFTFFVDCVFFSFKSYESFLERYLMLR